jgi:TonB family protein
MQTGTKRKRDALSLGLGAEPGSPIDRGGQNEPGTGSPLEENSLPSPGTAAQTAPSARDDGFVEFSPNSRPPRLHFGIDWESPWREFRSSLADFVSGQRVPKSSELPADTDLRVQWIEGRNSPWAFAASSLWHVAAVLIAILPIWAFLPTTAHNLSPVQIDVSWAAAQDLPPIHLQAPDLPVPKPDQKKPNLAKIAEEQAPAPDGADAYHPRQTILSIPVHVTHPRQTLIEPDAPMTPPSVDPQLPNIVQWAANSPAPKPELQLAPSATAPRMRERRMESAVAPDVANTEKNPGPLNIASSAAINPAPQMPMAPMSASTAQFRRARVDGAAAPQVNAADGDASLRNVIALSASPAPPAPVVAVPRGNLAARVAISPSGMRRGVPGGSNAGSANGASGSGVASSGSGSLPAAVSVSGGSGRAAASGSGFNSGGLRPRLILTPTNGLPLEHASPRSGPANVASLGANEAPEALFSGKEIHTLDINLPNVTSISGSWILNFAQLDDNGSPFNRPKGVLSSPVPFRKVDPKYPENAIRQNIEGEVVLYAIIRANGSVDSIQVVRHLDPLLDGCAVQALAQWKFRPATRDGKPVDVETIVHIPFKYKLPEQ